MDLFPRSDEGASILLCPLERANFDYWMKSERLIILTCYERCTIRGHSSDVFFISYNHEEEHGLKRNLVRALATPACVVQVPETMYHNRSSEIVTFIRVCVCVREQKKFPCIGFWFDGEN